MSTIDVSQAVRNWIEHHTMDNPHAWPIPFLGYIPLPAPLSLHTLMLFIAGFILILTFGRFYRKNDGAPRGLTNFLEIFVIFVRDQIAIANLGPEDGRRLAPHFCTLFFFILTLNIMGLIPLFSTATANIGVTAGLAGVTLFTMIGGGVMRYGPVGFIKNLLPHGVPWPVLLILLPIEIVGLLVKPFALTIRLFANLMAGHVVLFSLIGLAVTFGLKGALPAVGMAVGIYFLELLVAFLQAFIFTLLSSMFVGAMLHPEH